MVNNYSYSKDGLELTEGFEACGLSAYQDSGGIWTIGVGHTGPDVHPGMTITQAQAEELLAQDVQVAVDTVNRLVTVKITQAEFDALVDFAFNIGVGAFARSTLLRDLNAGDFATAVEQLEAWDHVNGKVVVGLLRRRVAEAKVFNGEVGK